MRSAKDISGLKINRWTIISYDNKRRGSFWNCVCDCGTKRVVNSTALKLGKTKSCGCLKLEKMKTHQEGTRGSISKEYRSWVHLKERCNNPNHHAYHRYGGRGISVCKEWRDSYETFLLDMGRAPSKSHSVDRKNNDGNYEPSNCRWATKKEQSNNRVNTKNNVKN